LIGCARHAIGLGLSSRTRFTVLKNRKSLSCRDLGPPEGAAMRKLLIINDLRIFLVFL